MVSLDAPSVIASLKEGNKRFTIGQFSADISERRRKELVKGQHPIATILTCSDSRVVPEYIFDQGLGNLFIVRTAGETNDDLVIASLEYGTEHLETPILMILGHSKCGAIAATTSKAHLHGHLPLLVHNIEPAMHACENLPHQCDEDFQNDVIKENVLEIEETLLKSSEIIKELVEKGKLTIIGAIYNIETGIVDFLQSSLSHQSERLKRAK